MVNIKEFLVTTLTGTNLVKCKKVIAGIEQTGTSLSNFIGPWAEALMTSNDLPIFASIIDATAAIHYGHVVGKIKEEYLSGFKQFSDQFAGGLSHIVLEAEHGKRLEECLNLFRIRKSIGNKDFVQKYEKRT